MRNIIGVLFLCSFSFTNFCQAQIDTLKTTGPENGFFFEFLGSGGLYSFNYERLFTNQVVARVGLSYLPETGFVFHNDTYTMPLSTSYLFKSGKGTYYEIGGGSTLIIANKLKYPYLFLILGLRGQDELGKNTFYRISFIPSYDTAGNENFILTGGLSIGVNF